MFFLGLAQPHRFPHKPPILKPCVSETSPPIFGYDSHDCSPAQFCGTEISDAAIGGQIIKSHSELQPQLRFSKTWPVAKICKKTTNKGFRMIFLQARNSSIFSTSHVASHTCFIFLYLTWQSVPISSPRNWFLIVRTQQLCTTKLKISGWQDSLLHTINLSHYPTILTSSCKSGSSNLERSSGKGRLMRWSSERATHASRTQR